jgi:hypothetical protein
MSTIYVRLDPRKLQNPDLDIRYALPDLISEKSNGAVTDDGYDYAGDVPYLVIALSTEDIAQGMLWVMDTLEHARILGNDLLPAAVVAIDYDGQKVVKYPNNFQGSFPE